MKTYVYLGPQLSMGTLSYYFQGTLDVMVQRTGSDGQGNFLFVQNNFYYDAFFLKAIGKSAHIMGEIFYRLPVPSLLCSFERRLQ